MSIRRLLATLTVAGAMIVGVIGPLASPASAGIYAPIVKGDLEGWDCLISGDGVGYSCYG